MNLLRLKRKNGFVIRQLLLCLFTLLAFSGLTAQTTFEGFEPTNPSGLQWTTDTPNNQWVPSNWEPCAGTGCMISGGFYNNSVSNLNLNINVLTAGNISFYMKTDTEYWGGPFGDFLKFYIDGVLQGQWAGTIGWTARSYPITAGIHNLSWSFTRDNSDTGWDGWKWNRAWIDNITFPTNYFFTGAGYGSAGSPYQISTAAQLSSMRNYLGSTYATTYFKLMNDIDLAAYLASGGEGYTAWGAAGWLPVGTNTTQFQGHFDGNYKTISGLMINRSTYADCGLWGATGTTTVIENLSLASATGSTVQGGNAAGMMIGRNNGTISNCSATGSVRGTLWNGGLVGWNNGTLNRCCASGDVISTGNTVGGLVGQNNGYINDSFSLASARGYDYIGGLVGYQTQSGAPGIANSFATGSVTNFGSAGTKGGLLGYLTAGTVSNSYWDTQTTGLTTSYGSATAFGKTTLAMQTQSTFSGWDFAGETTNGTSDYWFINAAVNGGYPYLVWQQTGSANPVMPHINVSAYSLDYGEMYPQTTSVQSITITNSGQLPLNGTITTPASYTVSETAQGSSSLSFNIPAGSSQVYNISFIPTTYGTFNDNVVISSNSETQSTFILAVYGICIPVPETFAGGSGTQSDPWLISTPGQLSRLNDFLGSANADKYYKIINDMDMTDYFLEGNPGYNYGYFWTPIGYGSGSDNYFRGKVDGNHCTISGFKANHLYHTNNEANIGLFGCAGAGFEIKNLNLQTDGVAGWHQVGGLVGANYGTIDNCHVTATNSSEIVGLLGIYCGGLVGINIGTISRSSFHGNVHGTLKVGGLVGAGGNIYNCFVTGKVTGYDRVGGFVGSAGTYYGAQFQNCFAAVEMEYPTDNSTLVGGFVSEVNNATFTSCYWNRQLSNTNSSAGISSSYGKTTAEMMLTSTYVGYDMDYLWQHQGDLNNGYPFIRLAPATAIFNQNTFSASLLAGSTGTQTLTITNTGAQTLAYTASVEYLTRTTQTILQEDFEHGGAMPAGWTQEVISGDNLSWTFRQGSPGLPNYAHNGYGNANLADIDVEDDKTMLVSPPLDLATYSYSPQLNFFHFMQYMPPYGGDQMSVYYRTSATGPWTLLQTLEQTNYWASNTIALPNPSSEYYIAFEGNARAGWGISIDDVTVTASASGYADSWLSLDNQLSYTSQITSRNTDQIVLDFDASHLPVGTYQAQIYLNTNAYNDWQIYLPVTLEVGYGDHAQIAVNPSSLSYGEVLSGSTTTQSFTLSNIGGGVLTGIIQAPAGYSVLQGRAQRNTQNFSIPVGGSQSFDLSFNPATYGDYNGSVNISSNSLIGDVTGIPVTGTAYTLPTLTIDSTELRARLATGSTGTDCFTLHNAGSQPLNYNMSVSGVHRSDSGSLFTRAGSSQDRSIAGSTLNVNVTEYTPGIAQDWVFTVHNNSSDYEWLKYINITLPAGVVVNSVGSFIGGSGGAMTPDQTSGTGIMVTWTGINAGWGVVKDNETAVATVNVTVPAGMNVPLNLPYQITGDIYGAEPHFVTGSITLEAGIPAVLWFSLDSWDGTLSGNSSLTIQGNFSADMQPGLYEAVLTINSNDSLNPVQTLPIFMEVTGPAGPVVRLSRSEAASLLEWDAVTDAVSYRIYRSESPTGTFSQIGETSALSFQDTSALDKAFYQVTADFQAPAK